MLGLIFRNSFRLTAARFFSAVLAFSITTILVNKYGIDTFGIISIVFSFVGIFELIFDFGLSTYLVRESSVRRSFYKENFKNFLIIKYLLTGIGLFAILGVGYVLNYGSQVLLCIGLYAIAQAFASLANIYRSILYVDQDFVLESLFQTIYSVTRLGAVFLIAQLFSKISYVFIFIGFILSSIVFFVGVYHLTRGKNLKIIAERPPISFSSIFRSSSYFGLLGLVGIIYYKIDVIMLSKLCSHSAVGIYSSMYRLVDFFAVFSGALGSVLLPTYSRALASQGGLKLEFDRLNALISKAILPIFVASFFYSKWILDIFFPSEVVAAHQTFSILSGSIFFLFWNVNLGTALIAHNRQNLIFWNSFFCAVLNISLNALLIPKWGINGSACATVATELLLLVLNLFWINRLCFSMWKFGKNLLITLSIALFTAFLMWRDPNFGESLTPIILMVLVFYFVWTEKSFLVKALKDFQLKKS